MAKEKAPKLTKEEKKALKEQKKAEKLRVKEEKKRAKAEGREYIPEGKKSEDDSDGSAGLVVVAVILIALVWLGILAFLIKMDVGGIGSTVLYPVLKDVPVIKYVLPHVEGAEEEELVEEDPEHQFKSMAEAVDRIKELETQLENAQKATGDSDSKIAELEEQNKELAQYKAKEAEFEENKEKFYDEVVFSDDAPDIKEYKTYYESIDPENAEKIYRKVIEQLQADAKVEDYAKTYSSMKPDAAAAIFDTMTDDLALVARILDAMTVEDRSKILAAMSKENAARLTQMMNPMP